MECICTHGRQSGRGGVDKEEKRKTLKDRTRDIGSERESVRNK